VLSLFASAHFALNFRFNFARFIHNIFSALLSPSSKFSSVLFPGCERAWNSSDGEKDIRHITIRPGF